MEWISVRDKEPLKDGTIYLGYENGKIFVFGFSMSDWHEASMGEIAYEVCPTHWMPLPKPPKDE